MGETVVDCLAFWSMFIGVSLSLIGFLSEGTDVDWLVSEASGHWLNTLKTGSAGLLLPWLHVNFFSPQVLDDFNQMFSVQSCLLSTIFKMKTYFILYNYRLIFEVWVKRNCLTITLSKTPLFRCLVLTRRVICITIFSKYNC